MCDTQTRLSAPFATHLIRFKPAVVSGNRALALAYVDARAIMDRLDDVFGLGGWQDKYEALPDGSVICTIRFKIDDEWIEKSDVGGPSEQPDEGDRRKAAFSDALKRAAVKLGIGRYLYRMPSQWCDYDPQKRQFVTTPTLPREQPGFEFALKAVQEAQNPERLAQFKEAYLSRGYSKLQLQLLDAAHDRRKIELSTAKAS